MQNKAVCIIPARGGSKRIPRKNIKNFLGKPIIAYSIDAAKRSKLFDEIMVSTDDEEIAEIAKSYGAKVPFMRSAKASDDHATTADVLLEALKDYKNIKGITFDFGCCLYACAPLIREHILKEAFHLLTSENLDIVFPVSEYSTPIKRALSMSEDRRVSFIFKENELARSQDLDAAYFDAGQFYWFDRPKFEVSQRLTTSQTKCIVLPAMQVQDIDNEDDWKLAEMKYTLLK